ncbi:hypothetical protein SAMN05216176_11756 [Nitratireductor indicus]|nr:hypothetical protein SAMN05216176_11756 [Nitratireductor indicus]
MVKHVSYNLNILANMIDDGYTVSIHCHQQVKGGTCGHHARLDLEALAKRFGRDFVLLHHTIVPYLRCSKCGAKGGGVRGPISIQMHFPHRN